MRHGMADKNRVLTFMCQVLIYRTNDLGEVHYSISRPCLGLSP